MSVPSWESNPWSTKDHKMQGMASSIGMAMFLGVIVFAVGLYRAIDLRWLCNDAFISFRYVKNLVEGSGLVFNPGEHVEGYTHFLWVGILSVVQFIGIEPATSSVWLGVMSYAAVLLIFLAITWKIHVIAQRDWLARVYLPVTATMLALTYDMNIWATSGLETAFFTLLISLAFYAWFFSSLPLKKRLARTGLLLALITLTRPDGILFTIAALVLALIKGLKDDRPKQEVLGYLRKLAQPSIVIGILFLAWKYMYYGDLLPNTFYMRSAAIPYVGQGLYYIGLFFRVYWSTAVFFVMLGVWVFVRWRAAERDKPKNIVLKPVLPEFRGSALVAAATMALVYLVFFVMWVGGDFMFARFIIPVLPLMYFVLEGSIYRLPRIVQQYRWGLVAAMLLGLFVENANRERALFYKSEISHQMEADGLQTRGIFDARWHTDEPRVGVHGEERSSSELEQLAGEDFESLFAGIPLRVATFGDNDIFAYYANFSNVVEMSGRTNSVIAHESLAKRGQPGFEKFAGGDELGKLGVQLRILRGFVQNVPKQRGWEMVYFELPKLGLWKAAEVVQCDTAQFSEMKRRFKAAGRKLIIQDFSVLVPDYIAHTMATSTANEVEGDLRSLDKIYFSRYPDPEARKKMLDYIAQKRSAMPFTGR